MEKDINNYLDLMKRDRSKPDAAPVFNLRNMMISQVVDLSNSKDSKNSLSAATIQNWVRRGIITPPNGKKYSMNQVATILLLDDLRGIISLEDANKLLGFITGNENTDDDDIIEPGQLYRLYAEMMEAAEERERNMKERAKKAIAKLQQYNLGGKDKGKAVMTLVILSLLADAKINRDMANHWIEILENDHR